MSLLVLGGTGTLGRQIVRKALDEGFQVKCLVRNFRKAVFLKEWGAQLVYGDLKLPETIPMTLIGITAIIDASTARPSDLYNAKEIDLYGKYILIEAAKKANIKKYIFFSILNASKYSEIPLMSLKLKIENTLINSDLDYTIFSLAGFFQGLINQYALPVLDKQSIWITGDTTAIAYMDTQDVAKCTVKSLSISDITRTNLPLVGNSSWTSLQIIKLCEKLSGQRSKISRVPVYLLRFARRFTQLFQWAWNISDRLAFTEIIAGGDKFDASMDDIYNVLQLNKNDIMTLELYMQEYFSKIMKKLKELNYKVKDNTEEIKF
uniref:hypothetical protein n=1 Tax=Caulacanthus ustulatus TaxID=31411 RepID=UPI0027DA85ED|nr:hypothetical protein REQ00_pgp116 [Caulacanthus ustulatus]WCH57309.1 hypothetical protein [Caulacanthus ustulatus]